MGRLLADEILNTGLGLVDCSVVVTVDFVHNRTSRVLVFCVPSYELVNATGLNLCKRPNAIMRTTRCKWQCALARRDPRRLSLLTSCVALCTSVRIHLSFSPTKKSWLSSACVGRRRLVSAILPASWVSVRAYLSHFVPHDCTGYPPCRGSLLLI